MLSSINNFGPFEADVWGTVSDWALVIVTALTAIFIYRTFRAQLNVTEDQSELLKIERIKLREQFRTELEISGGNTWTNVNTVRLNIKAVNHPAYNVVISNLPVLLTNGNDPRTFDLIKIEKWQNVIEKAVDHEDLHNKYNIQITYEDANGLQYSQVITGSFEFPVSSRPEIKKASHK